VLARVTEFCLPGAVTFYSFGSSQSCVALPGAGMVATRRSSRVLAPADCAVQSGDLPLKVGQEPICVFTAAEVARHNRPTDCWVVVRGQVRLAGFVRRLMPLHDVLNGHTTGPAAVGMIKLHTMVWQVYDVTRWVPHHPGGHLITIQAGRDCTQLFDSYHPASAR
jgi:Cytochrome b5-like Heme/Steroid binding domain